MDHQLGRRRGGFCALAIFLGVLLVAHAVRAAPFAYVSNFDDDTVSVIDTAIDETVATIAVGNGPDGVAVSADGTRVYVTNSHGASVSVIDAAASSVIATITTPTVPVAIAIHPTDARAYLAHSRDPGIISIIDTALNALVGTFQTDGRLPGDIALSPDGAFAYLPNRFDVSEPFPCQIHQRFCRLTVSVFDTQNEQWLRPIEGLGGYVGGIAVSPDGRYLYVGNAYMDPDGGYPFVVSFIDTTLSPPWVIARVPVHAGNDVAVNPSGTRVYAAGGDRVTVVDTGSLTSIATIRVGRTNFGVDLRGTERSYVTNFDDATVSVIDTADNSVVATVPVGRGAAEIAIGPDSVPFTLPPTPSPTATPTPSAIGTPTETPTPTTTATLTVTSSATATARTPCMGDCDENRTVTADELVVAVAIALGEASMARCEPADANRDNAITIEEIVLAVKSARIGCE
jgi:YVTN family beta-propeller protein